MNKKYRADGFIHIFISSEFEDDGVADLQDQANKALEDEVEDKYGIGCQISGDLELEGFVEVGA